MSVSINDLFVAGLGIEIAGAVLLARGLLIGPATMASLNTWQGIETGAATERCRNWVDAAFGVSYLLAGFILQAAGYETELFGSTVATGACRAYTAAAMGFAGVIGAVGLWWALRNRMLKRVIVRMALATKGSGGEGDEIRSGWTRRKAGLLLDLGEETGWSALPSELVEGGVVDYASRVFGAEIPSDLYEDDPPSEGSG
jgi:hypothetical protein